MFFNGNLAEKSWNIFGGFWDKMWKMLLEKPAAVKKHLRKIGFGKTSQSSCPKGWYLFTLIGTNRPYILKFLNYLENKAVISNFLFSTYYKLKTSSTLHVVI